MEIVEESKPIIPQGLVDLYKKFEGHLNTKSKREEESDIDKATETLKALIQQCKYEELSGF